MGLRSADGGLVQEHDVQCKECGHLIPEQDSPWVLDRDRYYHKACWALTDAGREWLAKRKDEAVAKKKSDVETGGGMPLFPGADPALGISIGREGGEVVLKFSDEVKEIRLSKANACLLRDYINLHQKHLGQQREE